MLKIIFISLIILVTLALNLQAENPDSLKAKATLLYTQEKYVDAIDTLNKAIEIYSERRDENGLARSYNNLGIILWKLSDTSNAMKYFIKARNYAQNVSLKLVSFVNLNIGHSYLDIGDNSNALYYYSLVKYDNVNIKSEDYYSSLINCANVFILDENYHEALKNIKEAYKYYLQTNDEVSLNICKNYLAHVIIEQSNNLDSIKLLLNNYQITHNFFAKKYLAEYYFKKGIFKKSLEILLPLLNQEIKQVYKFDIYLMISSNYKSLKGYDSAAIYLNIGLKQLSPLNISIRRDYFNEIYNIYSLKNDKKTMLVVKTSIDSLKKLSLLNEKQTNIKLTQALLISKYQIKSLEKNCDLIEQKAKLSAWIINLAIGILIILSFILILYRLSRKLIKINRTVNAQLQTTEKK